jgi:hypothetical protein
MPNDSEKLIPAYIPWETFTAFIGHLKATAVPSRIDKSMMPANMPMLTRGQIQSALRFLGLIGDGGTTNKELRELVAAYDTEAWPGTIKDTLVMAYVPIVNGLDLDEATQHQLDEKFAAVGVNGQMLLKSVRFYLAMLTAGGMTFSPHLMAKRRSSTPGARKKPTKPKSMASASESDGDSPAEEDDKVDTKTKDQNQKGTKRYPLYFKGKPDGSIVVPESLTEADCKVIELQLAVLRAYAEGTK